MPSNACYALINAFWHTNASIDTVWIHDNNRYEYGLIVEKKSQGWDISRDVGITIVAGDVTGIVGNQIQAIVEGKVLR